MNIDREELISRKFFHGWWLRIDRTVFRKGWIARVSDNPLPRQGNKVWEFFPFFFFLSPLHFVLKSRAHIVLQVYYSKHFLKYLPRVPGRVEEESHLLYLHRLFPWMKRNQGRERETLFWPKVPRLYDRWKIRDISRFSDTVVEIGGEGKNWKFR